MNETLLFLGGPADGRRQSVAAYLNVIHVDGPRDIPFTDESPRIYRYKKYVIRFEGGDVSIAVFDGMTPLQGFLMMCDKYPPQFGQDLNAG